MMEKLKKIKAAVIAAGVIASAAFYVMSGEGPPSQSADAADGIREVVCLSDEDKVPERPAGNVLYAPAGDTDHAAQATEGSAGRAIMTGLSDTARAEIDALIRSAVREELMAITREGYLEEALLEAANTAEREAAAHEGMININTADKTELMKLPGIGEKKAEDIIAYRESHGPFKAIEDVKKISGIKEAAFAKIRDLVYV
jgi:comEA protein